MTAKPPPMIPPEVDLRNFPFMPLYVERLKKSKAWLLCKRRPELAFYMMNLWSASWHERPTGSLENDDDVLMDRAMCPPERWADLKDGIMHGWELCSDGRLYNRTVAEIALESWEGKLAQRRRTAAASEARRSGGKTKERAGSRSPRNRDDNRDDDRNDHQETGTETGTETGINNNSSAVVDQEALKATGIIEAFDEELVGAFGIERKRPWPNPKDFVYAARWVRAGASAELCRPIFLATQRQRAASGQDLIGSLAYFDKAVERALDAANGPVLPKAQGAAPPVRMAAPAPQSRKERDRQWIEGWLKTDLWPISQGPDPLAVNHMIHPEIYGEFQDRIEAKRRAPKSRGAA